MKVIPRITARAINGMDNGLEDGMDYGLADGMDYGLEDGMERAMESKNKMLSFFLIELRPPAYVH